MFAKSGDKTLNVGPCSRGDARMISRRLSRRSSLATPGIAAIILASVVVGLGSPANARQSDNPSPGLLAKIQLATAPTSRTIARRGAGKPQKINPAQMRGLNPQPEPPSK